MSEDGESWGAIEDSVPKRPFRMRDIPATSISPSAERASPNSQGVDFPSLIPDDGQARLT
jgi:hypothetical protein